MQEMPEMGKFLSKYEHLKTYLLENNNGNLKKKESILEHNTLIETQF